MTCTRIVVVAALIGVFGAIAPAQGLAAPVEWFQFGPLGNVDVVTISYGAYHNLEVYAGQYGGTLATTQAGLSLPSAEKFYTFCVDLNDEVNLNQQYKVAVLSTNNGLTNGARIAYLYNTYGTTDLTGSNVNHSGLDGADYAAALQLAIWDELANNGSAPTATSALQYSGESAGVAAQVQNFLTLAATHTAAGIWLDSDIPQPPNISTGQGFVAPSGFSNQFQTPEPATLTLAGTALCTVFGFRYGRRRQRS